MPGAADRAYQEIRRRILNDGEFPAGFRLREQELSDAIGVSRTPIREALRRLSAEGFVEFVPNRGAHVTSWSREELNEIFELRALLESFAARRAAERISSEEVQRLDELVRRMEELAGDRTEEAVATITQLNNEFHDIIIGAGAGTELASLARGMMQVSLIYRTFRRYTAADLRRSFNHHKELVEGFRARDSAWVEAVMRSHILAARHIFDPDPEASEE